MKVYESSLKVLMAIPTLFWIIGPKNGQKSQITLELMEFLKSERKDKIFLLVFKHPKNILIQIIPNCDFTLLNGSPSNQI